MWEGGSYRTSNPKPKDHCTLSEFATLILVSGEKPDRISEDRWNAMLRWYETRQKEGMYLRQILVLEDGYYYDG
jgi:hypothetical protein